MENPPATPAAQRHSQSALMARMEQCRWQSWPTTHCRCASDTCGTTRSLYTGITWWWPCSGEHSGTGSVSGILCCMHCRGPGRCTGCCQVFSGASGKPLWTSGTLMEGPATAASLTQDRSSDALHVSLLGAGCAPPASGPWPHVTQPTWRPLWRKLQSHTADALLGHGIASAEAKVEGVV